MSEAAMVLKAKCPYCLEEIIQGAQLCKHCGKKQPLSEEERRHRSGRRLMIGVVSFVVLFFLLVFFAKEDYAARHAKMEQAAICGGLTYDQLEEAAQKAAKESNVSIRQAEDNAMILTCPSMVH